MKGIYPEVPYLTEEAIHRAASDFLKASEGALGQRFQPPIPIDNIVEKHLRLRVEMDDLVKVFGHEPHSGRGLPDILGALSVEERTIYIHEALDPHDHPSFEANYHFTLAHECGHWCLHRSHMPLNAGQSSLFEDTIEPSVICRRRDTKVPVEWQADRFASELLMPTSLVVAVWKEMFPDGRPRVLRCADSERSNVVRLEKRDVFPAGDARPETDDEALDPVVAPLAKRFLVSKQAMRIRLETLGLLMKSPPTQAGLFNQP